MPRCSYHDTKAQCPHVADVLHRVWCPTWVSAEEGPQWFCGDHIVNFKRETNPNCVDDRAFFWGSEADIAFMSVRGFFSKNKDKVAYENARGMLENGQTIDSTVSFGSLVVVDGEVWIKSVFTQVTHLGPLDEVRLRFPTLFTRDRFTPSEEEKAKGMVTKSAVRCGICQCNADRYDNRFECQGNPNHVWDLNVGIFSDLTLRLVEVERTSDGYMISTSRLCQSIRAV